MTSDLQGLLDRVMKATGPDRDLDVALDYYFTWEYEGREWDNLGGFWREHRLTKRRERFNGPPTPELTASIDAALALVERVLPGWNWRTGDQTRDGLAVWLGTAKEPTPALAILAELLRAKIAETHPVPVFM